MLTVYSGVMLAAKTTSLIGRLTAYIIAGKQVIAFKPANNTRYDTAQLALLKKQTMGSKSR